MEKAMNSSNKEITKRAIMYGYPIYIKGNYGDGKYADVCDIAKELGKTIYRLPNLKSLSSIRAQFNKPIAPGSIMLVEDFSSLPYKEAAATCNSIIDSIIECRVEIPLDICFIILDNKRDSVLSPPMPIVILNKILCIDLNKEFLNA